MKILYITNHFPLPDEAGSPRPWIIASFLAQKGHRITVIYNQRHYLTDTIPQQANGHSIYVSRLNGMITKSVWTPEGRKRSMPKRVINYICFSIMVLAAGLKVRKIDLVYTRTPPPLSPITGWLLSRLKKAKFVLEIGDLHPESAMAIGLISLKPLIRLWEFYENFIRNQASLIIAVVPQMKRLLEKKGFPVQKILINTNAWDLPSQKTDHTPQCLKEILETVKGKYTLLYAGGMGRSIALENTLMAAQKLNDRYPDICFLYIGQGDKKEKLIDFKIQMGLHNCFFFDAIPRGALVYLFKKIQAVFLSYYSNKIFNYILSNKIFEYLGSGKPIVYAGSGDIADIIKKAECGLVAPPENPEAFAEAVEFLYCHPQAAGEMEGRGLEYVKRHYDRRKLLTELEERMRLLCQNGKL